MHSNPAWNRRFRRRAEGPSKTPAQRFETTQRNVVGDPSAAFPSPQSGTSRERMLTLTLAMRVRVPCKVNGTRRR